MKPFTVVWPEDAQNELARLWNVNDGQRREITWAADEIDRLLAIRPQELGEAVSSYARQYLEPPLKVLFTVSVEDCLVKVLYVKLA
jgi:hypothetical protein